MPTMRDELHELGRRLWPDDTALQPDQRRARRERARGRLPRVALAAAITIATAGAMAAAIVAGMQLTHSRPQVPVAAEPHGRGTGGLGDLQMVSGSVGWSAGKALIARTTDGAKTFADVTPQGFAQRGGLEGFFALDAEQAWVFVDAPTAGMCDSGTDRWTLYRTLNGGATWFATPIASMHGCGVNVSFVDAAHGWSWAGGDLWRTVDGGIRWALVFKPGQHLVPAPSQPSVTCMWEGFRFRDPMHGLALLDCSSTSTPYVEVTEDGGVTWRVVSLPRLHEPDGFVWNTATDDAAFGAGGAVTVFASSCVGTRGTCDDAGVLYRSLDGGSRWIEGAVVGVGEPPIHFADAAHAWVPWGCLRLQTCDSWERALRRTQNGGATWETLPLPEYLGENRHGSREFDFVSATVGYAVSWVADPGGVHVSTYWYRTADGGETWVRFTPRIVRDG